MVSEDVSRKDNRAGGWTIDRVQEPPKRLAYGLLGFLLFYTVARGLVSAATKPFWYDEILTLTVASQPGLRAIWGALAHGVDAQPPIFHWIVRGVSNLLTNKQIGLRLPSILAMPLTMGCVFVYVKKRSGEWIALLCAVLLMLTTLFLTYTTEARPYSMVMACVAFALVCYQRLPSWRWAALLGIGLALAQALNYYAVFAMIPFGLAEAVVLLRTKQFRWPVWLAFLFGVLPLAICWPLLAEARTAYGAHFWARDGLASLPKIYGAFFFANASFGAAILAVLIVGVIGARFLAPRVIPGEEADKESGIAEGTLLLGFLALPVMTLAITKVLHGGMVERYVLATTIGITLAIACVLSLARGKVVAVFAIFVLSAVGIHEFSFWRSVHSFRLENPATPVEEFVGKAGHTELPVAVSNGLAYLPFAYYASPNWANRFVFLTDEREAVQYFGIDTADKNLTLLRGYVPLHVSDFSEFTSLHPEFLLYAEDTGYDFDWLPYHLSHEPWSLQVLAMEQNRRLYLVTRKEEAGR